MESEAHHPQAWLKQGVEHHQRGELDQARSCHEPIPPSADPSPRPGATWPSWPCTFSNRRAVQLLRQAINQPSDFVEVQCNLGAFLESLGRLDEAKPISGAP